VKRRLTEINDECIIDVDQIEYGVDRVSQEEEKHQKFQPLAIPAQTSVRHRIVK
jgi:hypothetical protein